MSLILEALRKSEAERQAAQLPGLLAPAHRSSRRGAARSRWLLFPLVLALGLLIGWLGPRWWTPTPAADSAADSAATATEQDPAPPASSPADVIQMAPPAIDTGGSPPALPAGPADRPDQASADAARPAAPVEPSAAAPAALPAPSAGNAPPVPDAAPLSQMPQAQRQQLPALRLSVHVFNDDAERRFALVDGRRVQDGADLGSGVRLREIRRDGLLLDVNGQPWLLERPR